MTKELKDVTVQKQVATTIADSKTVRLGGACAPFPLVISPAIADSRKVRLGGACPSL